MVHSFAHSLTDRAARAKAWGMNTSATSQSNLSELSFEEALKALEDVVRRLESGDVPLDDSITLYERGEVLRAACQARLDAAQARIERIVQGPDGIGTRPLDGQ